MIVQLHVKFVGLSVYSLFILDDMKPSSNYFQITLCGCQEINTLQDNKLSSSSTKRPYHNLYSCCTISIYTKKRSKSYSKKSLGIELHMTTYSPSQNSFGLIPHGSLVTPRMNTNKTRV